MILFKAEQNGEYVPIGEVTEVTEVTELMPTVIDPYAPDIRLSGGDRSFSLDIDRLDKRIWSKILLMPRYKATEWIFPKKKKRGTMRRKRNELNKSRAVIGEA